MDTNKKKPPPPKYFNPHLSTKKNHNPSSQKIPIISKINTPSPPPPTKKINLLNLHDLERFHKTVHAL